MEESSGAKSLNDQGKAVWQNPSREQHLKALEEDKVWDVVIVGGGATGAGICVDAAARGFSTLLVDAQDFSAGTSSRSTKLIHGGVRYMKNIRDWKLVREAMIERKLLLANAPHIVHPKAFILPCYKEFEREYFMAGLSLYSLMASGYRIGKTEFLSAAEVIRRLPGVRPQGLKGGVQFWDAQFDDSRLNIALLKTAEKRGASLLNYTPVEGFERSEAGDITTVCVRERFTGRQFRVRTRMVFNAAGVWVDEIRRMVSPEARPLVRASRGSHIMVSLERFDSESGMFIPKTPDGRVLFCIPWHGVLEIGTTDVEEKDITFSPHPSEEEIEFMLETARQYLGYPLERKDVLASFAGLRPLFNQNAGGSTAAVSREHSVIAEFKNMITVTGGKWTAYRLMAEHAMEAAVEQGLIYKRPCPTKFMSIYRDEAFDADKLDEQALSGTISEDVLRAYAEHCKNRSFAMMAEDVLYRRLRIGQMNEKRAQELLLKIQDIFA